MTKARLPRRTSCRQSDSTHGGNRRARFSASCDAAWFSKPAPHPAGSISVEEDGDLESQAREALAPCSKRARSPDRFIFRGGRERARFPTCCHVALISNQAQRLAGFPSVDVSCSSMSGERNIRNPAACDGRRIGFQPSLGPTKFTLQKFVLGSLRQKRRRSRVVEA